VRGFFDTFAAGDCYRDGNLHQGGTLQHGLTASGGAESKRFDDALRSLLAGIANRLEESAKQRGQLLHDGGIRGVAAID